MSMVLILTRSFHQRNQGRAGDAQSHALIVQAQMRSQMEMDSMLKKNGLNSMVNL